MAQDSAQHQRFVTRVHRRMVIVHTLEVLGVILLFTTLYLSLWFLVELWMGTQQTLGVRWTAIVVALFLSFGLIGALRQRPTRLHAARKADTQLNLDDLLSTVLVTPRDGAFADAVHAMADARCATLRPGDVILNRFGLRMWGGIGLSTALMLVLLVLSSNPVQTHATASRTAPRNSMADARRADANQRNASGSGPLPENLTPDHRVEADDPRGQQDATVTSPNNGRGQKGNDQRTDSTSGTTGGAGQSSDTSNPNPLRAHGTVANNQGSEGQAAGGTGASNAASGAQGASSSIAGQPARQRHAPAWASDNWPQSQQSAEQAVRSGQVPPAYQDLVRAYFAR